MLIGAGQVGAHDDIASSTPPTRSTVESPISTVEIDFGEPIGDQVSMFLTYDEGDANIVDLGGTTVKTGDTTARLDFDEIERKGTYFVQYLAPVTTDGHVVVGAITFTYGEPSGSGTEFPWPLFFGGAAAVLGIGAWFSYRRMIVHDNEPELASLPDVPDLSQLERSESSGA
jgi:methionine-rich copper-binding protein CopC